MEAHTLDDMLRMAQSQHQSVAQSIGSADVSSSLVGCIRRATQLPDGDDHQECALEPAFRRRTAALGQRILGVMQRIVDVGLAPGELSMRDAADATDEEAYAPVREATEALFEAADNALDASRGDQRRVVGTASAARGASAVEGGAAKPQHAFMHDVDNSRTPFRPKLPEKPHAKVPLDLTAVASGAWQEAQGAAAAAASEDVEYPHPYLFELRSLEYEPWMLSRNVVRAYKPLDTTPLTMVRSLEDLRQLCRALEGQREVAVDLEHHSYRSFLGLLCLMQLSTREQDYIVDVLALRGHMHLLNDCFANPAVVKVLHGADRDILWLQRDCGLYIVNMFDTGQAARVLQYSSYSLAHLLQHHCRVTANKQLQRADWRLRPLPADMVKYAREDTHYLLYIYDQMKNQLLDEAGGETHLLDTVLARSRELCEQRFEKPRWTPTEFLVLRDQLQLNLDATQLRVFCALFDWRDATARRLDESTRFVLPNHLLARLAQAMPTTVDLLTQCCNPLPSPVRSNAHVIVDIILQAKRGQAAEATARDDAAPPRSGGLASAPGAAGAREGAQLPGLFARATDSAGPLSSPPARQAHSAGARQSPRSSVLRAWQEETRFSAVPSVEALFAHAGWQRNLQLASRLQSGLHSAMGLQLRAGAVWGGPSDSVGALDSSTDALELGHSVGGTDATTEEQARQAADAIRGSFGTLSFRDGAHPPVVAGGGGGGGHGGDGGSGVGAALHAGQPAAPTVDSEEQDAGVLLEEDLEELAGLPKSMADIYRISNSNRRRNKDKKKQREAAAVACNRRDAANAQPAEHDLPASAPYAEEDADEADAEALHSGEAAAQAGLGYGIGRKRQRRNEGESDEFMSSLGWDVSATPEVAAATAASVEQAAAGFPQAVGYPPHGSVGDAARPSSARHRRAGSGGSVDSYGGGQAGSLGGGSSGGSRPSSRDRRRGDVAAGTAAAGLHTTAGAAPQPHYPGMPATSHAGAGQVAAHAPAHAAGRLARGAVPGRGLFTVAHAHSVGASAPAPPAPHASSFANPYIKPKGKGGGPARGMPPRAGSGGQRRSGGGGGGGGGGGSGASGSGTGYSRR